MIETLLEGDMFDALDDSEDQGQDEVDNWLISNIGHNN